ncbi:hypothetical protein HHK36_029070 [Tetracentron sinense]|uniref:Uncharacterized protein n=1 Tax=Tetracentron sinense TaxID=13715 RepID=A0A834YHD0_TETSI|nr:hypothetical protein HHK36_029070 [Tetracentron sinense]
MLTYDFSLPKTLNPSLSSLHWTALKKLRNPLSKTLPLIPSPKNPRNFPIQSISQNPTFSFSCQNVNQRRDSRVFAGRSKKKPGGPSTGRIEGNSEVRREAKKNARRKSKRLAENLFYRLKNPNRNQADNFSEEELQMIGLGYDRMVRFMEKDDPNLRHPYDWYKYGEYGPYSWRGVVVGEPIRGRSSDECVTLIGEVRDHEEWEKIEQFEMSNEFSRRLKSMDKSIGFRYFWVFVRHPKWKVTELPWQQWTLVCEVVLEAGKERLDKWNLMGRLGNKSRALITQCAAWMRPDIIYVKRPVFQCRFEPQDDFFKAMAPLLDPVTEQNYLFELKREDGRVEMCTYFGGLCKIVKVNPKAFVDDVVKAYEKLSDEKKSKCLEFLLSNHPVQLLHPYTKEWKAKLEEMELGCDAPDEDDDDNIKGGDDYESGDDDDDDDDGVDEEDGDVVMDVEDENKEKSGGEGDENVKESRRPKVSEEEWRSIGVEEKQRSNGSFETMFEIKEDVVNTIDEYTPKNIYVSEELNDSFNQEQLEELMVMIHTRSAQLKRLVLIDYKRHNPRMYAPTAFGRVQILILVFLRRRVRITTKRNNTRKEIMTKHGCIQIRLVY